MLHLNRLLISVPLLAFYSVACGDPADAVGTGGTGTTAGAAAVTAGTSSTSGGSGNGAGTASVIVTLAGSGQAIGGGDQGMLFTADGSVPIMPVEMGGSSSGGSGSGIPGDGNVAKSTLEGTVKGSATFTQVGRDVQIVVEFTSGCADGNHRFSIHDGGSCDDGETDGDPWSPRGTGLGPDAGIPCSGGKGKLEYTRKGDDATKNLTVADHNPETDLTAHVVIVSDEKDLNSRASCGNFFF